MKDFLKYLFSIPQRIGIYFAKRRALREHRAAVEHARKMERLKQSIELAIMVGNAATAFAQSLVAALEAWDKASRTKFPPGGIAAPGTGPEGGEWVALPFDQWYRRRDGKTFTEKEMLSKIDKERKARPDFPANDDREWFVPTPEQSEAIQRQNAENIRKSAEMWRKFKDPKKPNLYPAEE